MPSAFWEQFAIYFVLLVALGALWFSRGKKSSSAKNTEVFRDITLLARQGKIDPIIGRDEEINRVIHIINRRNKNNPLLVGEPGVGKTAIVEGLAVRIAEGNVPESLKGKRLIELNMAELVAGTKFRGDFEQRLRSVMKALEDEPRTTILFIDEIHVVEQTKGVEGAMSAADILKPTLARGDLPVIGATTFDEYEKYIRPEPALERRFQPVFVAEATPAAALAVLRGVKPLYEAHHNVIIDDSALTAAIELSKKLKTRHLPDKAIDLIDEACSKVSIEASEVHRVRFGLIHEASKKAHERSVDEAQALQAEFNRIHALRERFQTDDELKKADQMISNHLKELGVGKKTEEKHVPHVTEEDVAAVVKEWADVANREKILPA